jgi:hypothetical protein
MANGAIKSGIVKKVDYNSSFFALNPGNRVFTRTRFSGVYVGEVS